MMDMAYQLNFWAKYACVDSAVLRTSLHLRLFAQIPVSGKGQVTLPALAHSLQVTERGARVLVELLAARGILVLDEQNDLALSPSLAAPLQDETFLARLKEAAAWWGPSACLAQAVHSGQPVEQVGRTWDLLAHYTDLFLENGEAGQSPAAATIFDRLARHFLRTQALICAEEVGLLAQLGKGTAVCPPTKGWQVLLTVLTRLGLITATGEGYRFTTEAAQVLRGRSLATYRQGLRITQLFWGALGDLETAVRHDRRSLDLHDPSQSSAFYLALARYNTGIFPAYFRLVRPVPNTLNQERRLAQARVLDVGAGSGVWGAAFAYAEPTIEVCFLDQPGVLTQTAQNISRLKLPNKVSFWEDDLLKAEYGRAAFDIIILGQICHTQHPDQLPGLFQKLARALRPGGVLVVADLILNKKRDQPVDYLYFAVREFVSTQGDILSLPAYLQLLAAVGLGSAHCFHWPGLDVIIAREEGYAVPTALVPAAQEVTATWHFLSHLVIRRTGFPFEWLNRLTMPDSSAAAERLVAQQQVLGEKTEQLLKEAFPAAVTAARQVDNRQQLRALSKIRSKVGRRTLTAQTLAPQRRYLPARLLTRLEALCRQQEQIETVAEQVQAAVEREMDEAEGRLRAIATDPFFQEAIFLSNPDMYNNRLWSYLAKEADNDRAFAYKLEAYLQRFCAKNDTAAFFGPLNCGHITSQETAITIRRQGEKFSRREVFISFWAANALADQISSQEEIRPFLRPRPHPLCLWEGETIYFPSYERRVRLSKQQQAVLAQADGQRTVAEIAQIVGLSTAATVRLVDILVGSKALICRLELPSTIFHPFNYLLDLVESLPAAWERRAEWVAALQTLEAYRQAFVTADLPRRRQLLTEMDALFVNLTGQAPRRGAGKTYADRTLLYEDCAGTFEQFIISTDFFDTFCRRLEPILDLCAAHGTLLQQHYRALGHQVFQTLSATGEPVTYAAFITAVQQQASRLTATNCNQALDHLYQGLHHLVAQRSDGRVARLTKADLAQLTRGIDKTTQCHISPDVMLAAPSFEALCQGAYQVVLGEVHQVIYVWGSQLYFYPWREAAEEEMAAHIRQMTDYTGLATILNERQHKGLLYQAFPGTWIEIYACPAAETEKRVPLKFLEVAAQEGELYLQDSRTGNRLILYTAGDEQLHLWALAVPRAMPVPVRLGTHTPRIEVAGAVYAREQWLLGREAWGEDLPRLALPALLVRVEEIRDAHHLPRRVFAHVASEPKPYFVDFANGCSLLRIQKLLMKNDHIRFTEMLPDYDHLWLTEESGRFCCEFRMTACRY